MTESTRNIVLIALALLGLAPFLVAIGALFQPQVLRLQPIVIAAPGRACAAGAINLVFFAVLTLVLFSWSDQAAGLGKVLLTGLGLIGALSILTLLSVGLASVAQAIGARARPEASAFAQALTGAGLLTAGSLVPLLGWFVLAPYAASLGVGAIILARFSRDRKP